MLSKIKIALAVVLIASTASAAFARTHHRSHHHYDYGGPTYDYDSGVGSYGPEPGGNAGS
jgi:hypothetical protein